MISYDLSAARLRARWRKLRRDPAAFADDLPWPPLRTAALHLLVGATIAEASLAGKTRRLAADWLRRGMELEWTSDGYRLRDRDGCEPATWPVRLRLEPVGRRMLLCAEDAAGQVTGACELTQTQAGFLAPGAGLGRVRAYLLDTAGQLPTQIQVKPAGRAGVYRHSRAAGTDWAAALRLAWPAAERRPAEMATAAYRQWIRRNEPGAEELATLAAQVLALPGRPSISVLMPVHDPEPGHLDRAIRSVQAQAVADWQLCIADDGSTSPAVAALLARAAEADPRIRMVRLEPARGVAGATNAALALADGEACLLLDHDDELAPHALALIAAALAQAPQAVAVYSDEDTIDAQGRRSAPVFKPDFDAERLLAQNYVNHAFAVRTQVLRRLGGLRDGLDGAQDHDLVLRVAEAGPIVHLPHVLYHWRSYPGGRSLSQREPERMLSARKTAVQAALRRAGRRDVVTASGRGVLDLEPVLPQPKPRIAAIVPTRNGALLHACAVGLLEETDYPDLELHVVDNGSSDQAVLEVLDALAGDPRVRIHRIDQPFNFSALNNAAAAKTTADLLLFLNDDVLVAQPGWLLRMAALASRPDVGAVGARLLYPDGRLQHAGLVLGLGPQGVAGHEFRAAPGDTPGPQGRLTVTREVCAVTAACMVVARSKFEAAGGFDERLAVAFNDLDLSLKLRAAGLRNLWTPRAQLIHMESATRGSDRDPERAARFAAEVRMMHERWGDALRSDPFYNPNLTLEDESFTPAAVSRAPAIWR